MYIYIYIYTYIFPKAAQAAIAAKGAFSVAVPGGSIVKALEILINTVLVLLL